MSVNITFRNDTKYPLTLSKFSPDLAPSVDIDQSPAQILQPLTSTSFITSDPQFYGTGDESITIEWTEPTTGTVFGLSVDYPLSIAGLHPEEYGWGYLVSPSPAGTSAGWVKQSSKNVADPVLSQSIAVQGNNSPFLYSIQPELTDNFMVFTITIGALDPVQND